MLARILLVALLVTLAAGAMPRAGAQAPLPTGCQELILDGGFEAGDGWLLEVTPWQAAIVNEGARTGQQAAFIGLRPEDENVESHSLIQQQVALPAEATQITLSLWLRPLAEPDAGDRHYVLLLSDQGELAAVPLFGQVTGDSWQEQVFDITPLAGQTLSLQIGVSNNGVDQRTALLVDDVALVACQAAASDAPTATATPTETPSPTATPLSTDTPEPTPLPPPSPTPTTTPSPSPTVGSRALATPTAAAAAEAPTTPTVLAARVAAPTATPTTTPTPTAVFDLDPPPRQLPLLDSQAAPILIATLLSSVVILTVLALNTRRPSR